MIKTILLSTLYTISLSQPNPNAPYVPVIPVPNTEPPITIAQPHVTIPISQTTVQPQVTTVGTPAQSVTTLGTPAQGTTVAPITTASVTAPFTPPGPPGIIPPPPGFEYGAYGQLCEIKSNAVCPSITSSLTASGGFINCETDYSCCLCKEIVCNDCITFVAGDSGIFGVQTININGQAGLDSAIILQGLESGMNSIITGTNIKNVIVTGVSGAKNAMLNITDPQSDFKLHCTAMGSCEGLQIKIIFSRPAPGTMCSYEPFRIGAVDCSGQESCKNIDFTIENNGCQPVLIDNLQCSEIDSCTGAAFNFIGDVETVNCDLGTSGHSATGLSSCYQNLQALLCQDPNSCRGIRKTLTNPGRGFSLECGSMGSCQSAQLTLNFDTRAWMDATGMVFKQPTSWIDGFKFVGESAGAMSTIVINNMQAGKTLDVEKIECNGFNACAQMTIITGKDVEIVEMLCEIGTCDGCLVKVNAGDPGKSCYLFGSQI